MTASPILLATDLSCRGDRAMDRATALALEWSAPLVAVHALAQALPVTDAPSWRRPLDPRDAAMRRLRADLRAPTGLDLELVVERVEPAALVLDLAAARGASLIVVGLAHDDDAGRAGVGSTITALARRATVPVLAVKTRPHGPYRDVIVATDFSEGSGKALITALELFGTARVRLFHAYQVVYEGFIDDKMAARTATGRQAEAAARDFLARTPVPADRRISTLSEYGPPAALLRDLISTDGVDLVVAGTRGRGPIAEFFLGSVTKTLLAELPGDVMIVPRAG